ncbi:MAG: 6-bladed beta-propeller [Dysgonamonadaceae bacterium]|jgi:hypothetical protein|nr:6-bladed beta-propeller [Dysgonamonadaceae bacterium]
MKRTVNFLLIMVFTVFAGCREKNPAAVKNGELTVCYKSMLTDTIDIPLSLLTDELQIVKLDTAGAALVKDDGVTVSDNYLVVSASYNLLPAKLFDRKTGKYIADIGAIGQGPGEYSSVLHTQIDEKHNRIYFATMMPSQILSYDFQGNFKDEGLRIPMRIPKCIFHVNSKDSIITFAVLPFKGIETLVWSQKNGQVIRSYPVGNLSVNTDFSNEIIGTFNNENIFDFQVFDFSARNDSLYHYDITENKLTPVFTMDFDGAEPAAHIYVELPLHYMGSLVIGMNTVRDDRGNTMSTPINKYYIVDKKTLKASYFRLKNDFLGNIEIDWPIWQFKNGYFSQNMDPSVLREQLEKTLEENKTLSEEMRTKLAKLKDSINDDMDNNYILYAKLKK